MDLAGLMAQPPGAPASALAIAAPEAVPSWFPAAETAEAAPVPAPLRVGSVGSAARDLVTGAACKDQIEATADAPPPVPTPQAVTESPPSPVAATRKSVVAPASPLRFAEASDDNGDAAPLEPAAPAQDNASDDSAVFRETTHPQTPAEAQERENLMKLISAAEDEAKVLQEAIDAEILRIEEEAPAAPPARTQAKLDQAVTHKVPRPRGCAPLDASEPALAPDAATAPRVVSPRSPVTGPHRFDGRPHRRSNGRTRERAIGQRVGRARSKLQRLTDLVDAGKNYAPARPSASRARRVVDGEVIPEKKVRGPPKARQEPAAASPAPSAPEAPEPVELWRT